MEIGKNWGVVDPTHLRTFQELGRREQSAVKMALDGIHDWQRTETEPKLMRVKITSEAPFSLKGFAGVMHELGVGLEKLSVTEDTVVFQPRPYSRTFMSITVEDKLERLRETLEEEIDRLPQKIQDIVRNISS